MNKEHIASHAQEVLSNPVFQMVVADLEKTAVDAVAYAEPQDHDARQARAAEIRAIRWLVARLTSLTNSTVERKAPTVA